MCSTCVRTIAGGNKQRGVVLALVAFVVQVKGTVAAHLGYCCHYGGLWLGHTGHCAAVAVLLEACRWLHVAVEHTSYLDGTWCSPNVDYCWRLRLWCLDPDSWPHDEEGGAIAGGIGGESHVVNWTDMRPPEHSRVVLATWNVSAPGQGVSIWLDTTRPVALAAGIV